MEVIQMIPYEEIISNNKGLTTGVATDQNETIKKSTTETLIGN